MAWDAQKMLRPVAVVKKQFVKVRFPQRIEEDETKSV